MESDNPYFDALSAVPTKGGIRKHLIDWQEKNGTTNVDLPSAFPENIDIDGITNDSMKLKRPGDAAMPNDHDLAEEFREDYGLSRSEDNDGMEYEYLAPGDFVEVATPGSKEPTMGIFVREFVSTSQIYCINGKWAHAKTKTIPFSIPNFLDPALLTGITPYLPQDSNTAELSSKTAAGIDVGVPRELGAPILTKLRDLWREVQEVYRKHASILDNAHEILAHQTDLRFGTLEKITVKLLGGNANDQSQAALCAVRRALVRSQGFSADVRSHRFTRVFLIHPKESFNNIAKTAGWIREWQDAQAKRSHLAERESHAQLDSNAHNTGASKVDRFIRKAKSLVQQSRKIRPKNELMSVSPSITQHSITPEHDGFKLVPSVTFDKSDQMIIQFLLSCTLTREFSNHPQHQVLASAVVRGVDESPKDTIFTFTAQYKLLQEIGVIKPYENRTLQDEHLLLPNSQKSKPLERLREKINKVDERANFPDSMHHLRRDWKDLTVYTIDGKMAMNIDDGISIEPVPGQPEQWWVRIHIANPTARISKDDDIARMAAHMTETYYAPDDHHWMMPSWITQKFMSIAPDRPVLTFSARVNKDCELLEHEVQSGIVRNVQKLTPRILAKLLDQVEDEGPKTILTVGNSPKWFAGFHQEDEIPILPDKRKKELSTLLDLAAARSRYRMSKGGMVMDFPAPTVSTTYSLREGAPEVSQLPIFHERAHFIEGDPAIRMACLGFTGFAQQAKPGSASTMVMEMMLLAGEIGARWCSERNVPIMYRGTYKEADHSAGNTFTAGQFFELYLKPHVDRTGRIPYHLLAKWMNLIGRSATTLSPLPHVLSGLDQYAKVTTPLGRYGDMIAHWQIESALREEARTGKSLVGSKREDYLAFTRAELGPVVPRLRAREQLLTRSKNACELHWTNQLFFRAHHYNEADLPPTHEVVVVPGLLSFGWYLTLSYSKAYGCHFQIEMPQEQHKVENDTEPYGRPGDHWEVEITNVDTIARNITCKPLRLLHREPYSLDDLLKRDLSALAIQ